MATKKFLPLGTVIKKDPSGMVETDDGTRSYAKAEVGDTLRKNTESGDIEVVKAKPMSAKEIKNIKALELKIKELEDVIIEKDKKIKELEDVIIEKDKKIKELEENNKPVDPDKDAKDE